VHQPLGSRRRDDLDRRACDRSFRVEGEMT
jgi:hypothetical protein